MADKVNLRQSEYDNICTGISQLHTEQLDNINKFVNEIKTMITDKQVFSVNLTSDKINDMLDTVTADIVVLLEQIFEGSETGITSMVTSVTAIDSVSD